jgi:cysteinyl-tRNA synthetase
MPMPLPLKLYDSYLKKVITIDPDQTIAKDTLKMYSCGPTVYGYQHIGNMRAVVLADTIVKTAKLCGWKTECVLNITDVGHLVGDGDDGKNAVDSEDKIQKAANSTGQTVEEIVNFYTNDYLAQTKALNVDLPETISDFQKDVNAGVVNPKASEYIKEQMVLALELLRDDKAYLLDDGIYFDSEANKNLDVPFKIVEGDSNFTGRDIANTIKNPADFALWKFVSENTLQKWKFYDFPDAVAVLAQCQTEGRIMNMWGCPGWHSECVAMICAILARKMIKNRKQFTFSDFLPSDKPEVGNSPLEGWQSQTDGVLKNVGVSATLNLLDSSHSGTRSFAPLKMTNNSHVIDLHLGGEDHIDIHHKNEILQSEALGFHLSKYWVHNKFLTVDGKKMSKSVGNVYTVIGENETTGFDSIVSRGFDSLAFRLLLLENHYTNQMDFTFDKLTQSQARLHGLRKEIAKIISFKQNFGFTEELDEELLKLDQKPFLEILADNLNTPKFIDVYQQKVLEISNNIKQNEIMTENDYQLLYSLHNELLQINLFKSPSREIRILADLRWKARANKDWALSDEFRAKIETQGWAVDDYVWGYGLWVR